MPTREEKACPRCAETIKAAAKVCRYCGHEFGYVAATAHMPPKGPGNFKLGCAGTFLVVVGLMVIGNMVSESARTGVTESGAQSSTLPAGIVGSADAVSSTNPPDSFRGIKWDSRLPPIAKLRDTAMKGCTAIKEQASILDTLPCGHIHIDTDDIESYNQQENTPPFLGVPVSGQMLTWSHRKFWSGEVFSKNDGDFSIFRKQLILEYGPPTFENGSLHVTKWKWSTPNGKVIVQIFLDNHHEVSLLFSRED